jgi:hypothetical protein
VNNGTETWMDIKILPGPGGCIEEGTRVTVTGLWGENVFHVADQIWAGKAGLAENYFDMKENL